MPPRGMRRSLDSVWGKDGTSFACLLRDVDFSHEEILREEYREISLFDECAWKLQNEMCILGQGI